MPLFRDFSSRSQAAPDISVSEFRYVEAPGGRKSGDSFEGLGMTRKGPFGIGGGLATGNILSQRDSVPYNRFLSYPVGLLRFTFGKGFPKARALLTSAQKLPL